MTANVENMAYAGKVPWHGLGTKVSEKITPDEMQIAAGLDWEVQKTPFVNPITQAESEDWSMLVRSSDGKEFGPCGKKYVPVQNKEALGFFKKFTESGKMQLETAGSLDGGRRVFVLAKTTQSFRLAKAKDDKVDSYLFCYHPHIWGQSLKVMWTPIRVVCQNTLMQALGSKSAEFRMPHVTEFNADMQFKAESALGLADEQMKQFQDTAEILSMKEFTDQKLWRYWASLFQPSLVNEKKITPDMFNRTMEHMNVLLHKQPGAEFAKNTWWQALNTVTYYVDHRAGRERDAAMTSSWLGQKGAVKRKALAQATQLARAA